VSYGFPAMVDIVPEGKSGDAEVRHIEVSQLQSDMTSIRGGRNYVPAGRYAQLFVAGELAMSDTRHERLSNFEVVRMARGEVLIAGLGLGMILHPILANTNVNRVTVVERSLGVIRLIRPTLPRTRKLRIVQADIFNWRPAKGVKFDCIYFDIWSSVSTDDLAEMAKLHQSFKFYKAPSGWMGSWERDELRAELRQQRRNPWGGYRR